MTDTLGADTGTSSAAEHVVDVAGEEVVVRRAGAGRPVLWLHSAFFATRWLPFHDRLATDGVEVVAPLLPGYREGRPPDWLRGWDDLTLHLRQLLDTLELDAVHVAGHDLGGWAAANLATFHPERVRSLTLVAATGLRVPGVPALEFFGLAPDRLAAALFAGDPGPWRHLLPDTDDIEGFCTTYGENGVTARLVWERRYDTRLDRRMRHVHRPALVLGADEDRVVPVAHAHRWAELLPDARLEVLEGVGHAMTVEAPDRVARAIAAFTEEVER